MDEGNKFKIPVWAPDLNSWASRVNNRIDENSKRREAQWEKIASMLRDYGEKRRAEEEARKAMDKQLADKAIDRQLNAQLQREQRDWQSGQNDLQRALQDKIHSETLKAQQDNLERQEKLELAKRTARARGDFAALEDKYKKAYLAAKTAKDKEDVLEAGRAELRKLNGIYDTELEPTFKFESDEEIMKIPEPFDIRTGDWSSRTYGELEKEVDAWKKKIDAMEKGPEKAAEMKLWNEKTKGRFGALYGAEDVKKAGQKPIQKLPKDTPLSSSASEANEIIKKTGQKKKWNPKIGMWVVD